MTSICSKICRFRHMVLIAKRSMSVAFVPHNPEFATTRYLTASAAPTSGHSVHKLGVLGAGQMGLGIALVAAQKAELPVVLVDSSKDALKKAFSFADKLLLKDVSKKKISQNTAESTKSRITFLTDLDSLKDVDFVIEAVPEIPSLKCEIFSKLASTCANHTILGTNTSSIPITKIAAATGSEHAASRVVGTHFMNPVPVMKGVEIISALQTSEQTLLTAIHLCDRMEKVPSKTMDRPGFLANRILIPYINEAILCLENGIGTKEGIDSVMKHGTGVPMGPLTLADFIGLDTCLSIMNVLHAETGDSKYRPSILLKNMVDAGWLGKKSGRGFYQY